MIGILTFYWADDYGAMLQAYALKRCLEKVSKTRVEIIPYTSARLEGRYWFFPVTGRKKGEKINYIFLWGRFFTNVCYFRSFLRRRRNMRAFRRRHLTRKPASGNADRLSLQKYSCIFVGSDQVWNPEITIGLDDVYLGNIKERGDCIWAAYGASFGGDSLPAKYDKEFSGSVGHNFSDISLREKSAVPFVKKFFHGNVTDVLDPALLLERKEWEQIGKLPARKDYILFIYTEYNEQMLQYLQKLAKELEKKVVQLSMPWPGQRTDWADLEIEGGPSEYIGFFRNAGCVVTNSFHGMVFSILMEKNFLVFSHSDKNARMEDLMEKLELKTRLVERGRVPAKGEMMRAIDWRHVGQLLERERGYSVRFIEKILSGKCE
ncbi:MAG: polysaccharide pyruvyl transferase family protein [Ruminococcus sp.]|nr:polysaccharide pyruvyl transferase family protein [Ruminococcus sp.]